jgi:hypothetical protein
MSDASPDALRARIAALYVYPIKSCAGIAVDAMRFDALGPLDDRRWMLVDDGDGFVTQRELPKLALVRPARVDGGLRVLAPGMPALTVAGRGGERRATHVWDDRCACCASTRPLRARRAGAGSATPPGARAR